MKQVLLLIGAILTILFFAYSNLNIVTAIGYFQQVLTTIIVVTFVYVILSNLFDEKE